MIKLPIFRWKFRSLEKVSEILEKNSENLKEISEIPDFSEILPRPSEQRNCTATQNLRLWSFCGKFLSELKEKFSQFTLENFKNISGILKKISDMLKKTTAILKKIWEILK